MPDGYLAIVLHAHLPFVKHPEYENFLEEVWFYEAMAETYIPLVRVFSQLENDGVDYQLTLSLSPTLVAMMEDTLLQARFARHVERVIRLADREANRVSQTQQRRDMARYYRDAYQDVLFWFEEKCRRRVAGAFGRISRLGHLHLMTCGATHGFFPILQHNPGAVRAQLLGARDYHTSIFGQVPQGVWIPECAYYNGLEQPLAEAGFAFSFVDTHGLENASVKPVRGVYAPVTAENGVSFFARDRETSYQVWSAEQGYPGHPNYREFYRDLGYELPEADVAEFMIDDHHRISTGLKMYRITSRQGGEKALYNPQAAREQAAIHAGHFVNNRIQQVRRLSGMDRPPLIVAPYDAELFGHWWYEGPQFLDYVLRKLHYDQQTVGCMTPAEYLRRFPENQHANPAGSSWGGDGTYEFWINDSNQDLIPRLHQAADRLSLDVRNRWPASASAEERCIQQMTRELMLAQASDWPFIMRTGTSPGYARKRVDDHLARFWLLAGMIDTREYDETVLQALMQVDSILPDIDPSWYA